MNEIEISIKYSRFVDIFGCYFYTRMNNGLARPLVDVLPVIDLKPYKGGKKWIKN